jgi:hypothetical protein
LVGTAAGAGLLASRRPGRLDVGNAVRRKLAAPALDSGTGTGSLTAHEQATLSGLGEIVLPPLPPGDAARLTVEWVTARAHDVAGFRDVYREAVALLDAEAGRRADASATGARFVDLDTEGRQAVVLSLLPRFGVNERMRKARERLFSSRQRQRLRRLVVQDLLAGFYASPRGWVTIGHTHGPGLPASDPTEYTRLPGGTSHEDGP